MAFSCLATERQLVGGQRGGIGSIPWSKAVLYAHEEGFDRRMRRWFARVMLTLDTMWREHQREENERENKREQRRLAREQKRAANKAGVLSGIEQRRIAAAR